MIQSQQMSFGYKKSTTILQNLDLRFTSGTVYGLLGKNGEGKSTLLKLLAGINKPTTGHITLNDVNVFDKLPETLSKMYLLPEEFELPAISAEKFLNLYAPFYPRFAHESFYKNLEAFGVALTGNLTKQSMGQKKKFLISFALATNCPLILMDEPTNGLDIPSKSVFRKLMATNLTEDSTYIISTHQVRDLEQVIDHIMVLDDKQIVFDFPMYNITENLAVMQERDYLPENSLYAEQMLGAFTHLVPSSTTEMQSQTMSLEFLFNAIITNASQIKSHLNTI